MDPRPPPLPATGKAPADCDMTMRASRHTPTTPPQRIETKGTGDRIESHSTRRLKASAETRPAVRALVACACATTNPETPGDIFPASVMDYIRPIYREIGTRRMRNVTAGRSGVISGTVP